MAKSSPGGNDIEAILDAIGQLRSVVEEQLAEIHDRFEHITEVVRENTEEIGVLRDAIDDEREVIEWAAHNDKPIVLLSSMAADPAASDFAAILNRLRPEDLPPAEPQPQEQAPAKNQSAQQKLLLSRLPSTTSRASSYPLR